MKRILSLTAIFAMAMAVITGCEKETKPGTEPDAKTNLTLSVPAPAFKFDTETAFTVTAAAAVKEDLTVTVTSSNPAAATVPATVIIKAGSDKAEGKITGVAEGKTTIKIEATDVEYTTQSVEVTVTKDAPPVIVKVDVAISTTFAEVGPGLKIPFTVTAAAPVAGEALVVNVSSSSASATVPATVTIPVGETKITGEITGVSAGEAVITISGEKVNPTTATVSVLVKEGAATAVTLSITTAKADVEEGGKLKFTITSPVAPTADLTINVASGTPANATVPATIVLPAGKMSVQGDINAVAIGTSVITISAEGTTIAKATVDVNVIAWAPITYCELDYAGYQYAMLNAFKLGDVTVTCGGNQTYTGEGPLAANFEFDFNPQSSGNPEPTGAGDEYTLVVFADWNRTGTLTQVFTKVISAGSTSSKHTGTITIPEDAAAKSVIRAASYYSGQGGALKNGCGKVESVTVVDFTYTQE